MSGSKPNKKKTEMKRDINCNELTCKSKAYTTITRTIRVPNILITTLKDAADNTYQCNIVSKPTRKVKVSSTGSNLSVTVDSSTTGLAEKRRAKIGLHNALLEDVAEEYPCSILPQSLRQLKISPTGASVSETVKATTGLAEKQGVKMVSTNIQEVANTIDWESLHTKYPDVGERYPWIRPRGFTPQPGKCCCQRPKRTVWCLMCGFHAKGNVKTVCPVHPLYTYLYAWDTCTNWKCKAPRMLLEIDLEED